MVCNNCNEYESEEIQALTSKLELTVSALEATSVGMKAPGFRNMYKDWARTDLQEIFDLYNNTGVLSQLDYEEENRPEESCALFELSSSKVATHSQTTTLVDISLSFRVVA